MNYLHNKNILFISPCFFGYENQIIFELQKSEAIVDFLPDRPFQSAFMKAVTRIRREIILPYANRYFWQKICEFNRAKYDHIFIVLGECISPEFLTDLRSHYPSALFTLYMWDSFKNREFLVNNIKLFDQCFTFDSTDARDFGMKFRPLFFIDGFGSEEKTNNKYDISFIGTIHSDRYKTITSFKQTLNSDRKSFFYLYLQAPWVFWANKFGNKAFKGATFDEFSYSPLSVFEIQKIFNSSKAILDIQHPWQTGLTMRTIEAIGANKKLITTNKFIERYDFFKPENIIIIPRVGKINIPNNFYEESYVPMSADLKYKYSIRGWLSEILGG
jgi:hypothetical protein